MTVHAQTSAPKALPRRAARWALVGVEVFVAVGAVYGGIGLIAGNAIHISDDWLVGTPFNSWLLPGIFLLLIVAAPMAVAAVAELRRRRGPTPRRCWPVSRRSAGSSPSGRSCSDSSSCSRSC